MTYQNSRVVTPLESLSDEKRFNFRNVWPETYCSKSLYFCRKKFAKMYLLFFFKG